MAKKLPPGLWKEHTFYIMPDGKIMTNPGLSIELTEVQLLELTGKGWQIMPPKPLKKKPKGFTVLEPLEDKPLGPTWGPGA